MPAHTPAIAWGSCAAACCCPGKTVLAPNPSNGCNLHSPAAAQAITDQAKLCSYKPKSNWQKLHTHLLLPRRDLVGLDPLGRHVQRARVVAAALEGVRSVEAGTW